MPLSEVYECEDSNYLTFLSLVLEKVVAVRKAHEDELNQAYNQ